MKVDERVHQQDGETCIMRWREVLQKFEKMERCAPGKKKNSATLNQGGMLENDSKLNHIGSYLVGVLNISLFYLLLSSGLLVFFVIISMILAFDEEVELLL